MAGRQAPGLVVLVVGARPKKSDDFSGTPANPVGSTPNGFIAKKTVAKRQNLPIKNAQSVAGRQAPGLVVLVVGVEPT